MTAKASQACKAAATLLLLATGLSPVAAAGVDCTAADSNIVLELFLPLAVDGTGNLGGPMRGKLEIYHQKIPRERRLWSLEGRAPSQFWNVGPDLRVRVVIGAGADVIDFVIEAQQRSGGPEDRNGSFKLETGEGVRVSGRVMCSLG